MSAIADFESWIKTQILDTPEFEAAVEDRVSNSVAEPNTPFPYLIYQVTPLEDRTGQARAFIQTRLMCDVQIYSLVKNFPAAVDDAIEAFDEKIRMLTGNQISGNSIISMRRERPISRSVKGASLDQAIIARGSTYRVWVSRAG